MSATPRSCVLSTSTRLKNDSTVFIKEFFSLRSDERMKLAATCELLKRLSRSCSMEYLTAQQRVVEALRVLKRYSMYWGMETA